MLQYDPKIHELCFPFLDADEVKSLFNVLSRCNFPAKSVVLQPGESADHCLFILSGKCAVQKETDFVGKVQVVGLLDPGAPVGEAGLLQDKVRSSTVIAVEDSDVLQLSLTDFMSLQEKEPVLAIKLLKWVLGRVSLRLQKNSERLARVL